MANLSVRKLDNTIVDKLRLRAAQNGISMEEEVRRIITQAVSAPTRLGDIAMDYFGENNGIDLDLPEHTSHTPIDFS